MTPLDLHQTRKSPLAVHSQATWQNCWKYSDWNFHKPCVPPMPIRSSTSPRSHHQRTTREQVALDGFGWAWMGLDGFGGEHFLMGGSNPFETYECLGFIIPNWKDKKTFKTKKTYLSWLDKGVTYQLGRFQHLPLVTPPKNKKIRWMEILRWYSRWFLPLFTLW